MVKEETPRFLLELVERFLAGFTASAVLVGGGGAAGGGGGVGILGAPMICYILFLS